MMIEIIHAWEPWAQQTFAYTLLFVFWMCTRLIFDNARIILRGYPPISVPAESCDNGENLSGYCIKAEGNCKTRDECERVVQAHNNPLLRIADAPKTHDPHGGRSD